MLIIEDRHLKIIKDILKKYPYDFYAFGSRVKGNPQRFSDLDICFKDDIPSNIEGKISEEFEESDLPYKIDLINYNKCDPEFQNLIKNDLIFIQGK